jgi:hypothetical protein
LKKVIKTEHVFVTDFCGQYMTMFLTQKLHFSLIALVYICMGVSVLTTIGTGTVLIHDRLLEVPLRDQKIGVLCAITAS